jgi:hypothetical protein
MLPPPHQTRWRDLLTGVEHSIADSLPTTELFEVLPAAVLVPA